MTTPRDTLNAIWGFGPLIGHSKCGGCNVCNYSMEGKEFLLNGVICKSNAFSNCNTQNVINAVVCPCKKVYFGQTSQKIKTRICQHRSRLRCKTENAPLVEHFTEKGHTEDQLKWTVISVIKIPQRGGNISALLNKEELKFIIRLNCMKEGLNRNEDWTSLLWTNHVTIELEFSVLSVWMGGLLSHLPHLICHMRLFVIDLLLFSLGISLGLIS